MKKYVSIRFQNTNWNGTKVQKKNKTKEYLGFYKQRAHNRRFKEANIESNYLVNKELQELNIYKDFYSDAEVEEEIKNIKEIHKKEHKRSLPSNWKPFSNGLITFSPYIMEDFGLTNPDNQEILFNIIKDFLRREYNQGLISLDLHMDETTPHFHYMAFNYDKDLKISYSRLITEDIKANNRQNLQQDRLSYFLKSRINNFDYERGEIRTRAEYNKTRLDNKSLIQEQRNLIDTFKREIKEIRDFISKDEEDKEKFEKLLKRYLGNEKKFIKFVEKWKNKANKTNKKTIQPKRGI